MRNNRFIKAFLLSLHKLWEVDDVIRREGDKVLVKRKDPEGPNSWVHSHITQSSRRSWRQTRETHTQAPWQRHSWEE